MLKVGESFTRFAYFRLFSSESLVLARHNQALQDASRRGLSDSVENDRSLGQVVFALKAEEQPAFPTPIPHSVNPRRLH